MVERRTLLLGVTRAVALLPVMPAAAYSMGPASPVVAANRASQLVTPNRAWLCVGRAALAAVATRTPR